MVERGRVVSGNNELPPLLERFLITSEKVVRALQPVHMILLFPGGEAEVSIIHWYMS